MEFSDLLKTIAGSIALFLLIIAVLWVINPAVLTSIQAAAKARS